MTVDLSNVSVAGIEVDYSRKLNSSDGYGDGDIMFKGRISPVSDVRYQLKGILEITGVMQCANCLKDVFYKESHEIDEAFSSKEDIDDDAWQIVHGKAEIGEAITAAIHQVLPMKILCKDDCKGLCPICGKDLNDGDCNCKAPVDPRFDVLSSFFEDKEV